MSKRLDGIIDCNTTKRLHGNGFRFGMVSTNQSRLVYLYIYLFILISLIADGPHHYHPACGH